MPSSYRTSLLDLAVERLWAAGVVVVVSAGNGGPGQVDFAPGNDPLAITVGATDNADTLATPDDRPDTTLGQQAPAANRVMDNYVSISGTSFSAPQVAAAAAILLEQNTAWSPDQIKWLLSQTAQPLSGSSAGALSISAAVGFTGTPGLANQGVPALVCAPNTTCTVGGAVGTVSSSWNSSSVELVLLE